MQPTTIEIRRQITEQMCDAPVVVVSEFLKDRDRGTDRRSDDPGKQHHAMYNETYLLKEPRAARRLKWDAAVVAAAVDVALLLLLLLLE